MNLILALVAALAYGVSDYLGGLASRRHPVLHVILVAYPVSALALLLAAPWLGGEPTSEALLYGALSGASMALAIGFFYAALAQGPMSVVSPVTAVLAAAIPVGLGLLAGETLTALALLGVALALGAIVLVSLPPKRATTVCADAPRLTPAVLGLACVAGSAFALSFFLIHRIPAGGGLWPMLAARGTATGAVLLFWIVRRRCVSLARSAQLAQLARPKQSGGDLLRLGAWVGVLDGLANACVYYALGLGALSTTSVITSLYPVATVALAILLLGERVGRVQAAGMALAAVAVGLIAL
ncbi:EamA family transporter [Amphibiibacter pelophylacis]|uniref:EamA family transporter n=1 Tax=Amphibiibacter pelophylacis TaxID=1799477 RepID=A0ACC6NXV7_9BURK